MAAPKTMTAAELGSVIGVSARRVQQLAQQGIFEKDGRSKYPLAASVKSYIDHKLKSEIAKRDVVTTADEAVKIERARKLRLENEQTERSLVPMAAAVAAIDAIVGPVRSDLAGVPARVTDDVGERRAIEDAINTVLNGIADRLRKAGQALRSGRDPLQTGEEDDA